MTHLAGAPHVNITSDALAVAHHDAPRVGNLDAPWVRFFLLVPGAAYIITRGGYKLPRGPFTTLALKNLEFEDKATSFIENTLILKDKKPSGTRASPIPIVGDLQA